MGQLHLSADDAENRRIRETREGTAPWQEWGPYLSERQWGTIREDYSFDGNAWEYFTHDQARSRAYHWGEDGLAGISDEKQRLCFAVALWNGKDRIIKERLFGLTNKEGNHGEDVKEYYFYLDNIPSHSYMKYLYKYPQAAYPYDELVRINGSRGRGEPEYELLDTGVFGEDRYFDVFVEYAKQSPKDILIQITVCNRGPEAAALHLLPTLWFRNTWAFWPFLRRPSARRVVLHKGVQIVDASHPELGRYSLYCEGDAPLLFTENETNMKRVFGTANPTPFVKDGINNYLVDGQTDAVNLRQFGTKVAAHYVINTGVGETHTVRLRLRDMREEVIRDPFGSQFAELLELRRREADEFYSVITPGTLSQDAAAVIRQALAGMLWTKQYFFFDLQNWLEDHGIDKTHQTGHFIRNLEWFHMVNDDIISMPDKWEYPWYAAWDLVFHAIAISAVDVDLAKKQLEMLLQPFYLHPSGQVPAYEWNFSDVSPPLHAWGAIFLHRVEEAIHGQGDVEFLKKIFGKLMLNFSWWVNRKDRCGKNLFEGGFMGLDSIGEFDRNVALPAGGHLEQANGRAWMALFCQNMLEIAVELADHDPVYDDLAILFADQFLWIAHAVNRTGPDAMWDEEDGFYYDVLRLPDGNVMPLKVRSMLGLLPLCATTVVEPWERERLPRLSAIYLKRLRRMPSLLNSIHPTGPGHFGVHDRGIIALVNPERLRRILARLLDPNEFLSPYGIRALSRYHSEHPYVLQVEGREYRVAYLPAESDNDMFGGNTNWRGPVWMPVNVLLIRALQQFYLYYGDNFRVECPTGSGTWMNLFEVSRDIVDRLSRIFLRDESGRRPVFGGTRKFQEDPHWKDHLLFYEYFHGDNGAGLGASHQTGWTGLVARLLQLYGNADAQRALAEGKKAIVLSRKTSPPHDDDLHELDPNAQPEPGSLQTV